MRRIDDGQSLSFSAPGRHVVHTAIVAMGLLLAWLLAIGCAVPARAAGQEKRVALLIGNGAYSGAAALPNPGRDTAALAGALEEAGFSVRKLNDLNYNDMRIALRDFAREADGADWALVYFAGHGLEMAGQNYLVPVDARLLTDRDVPLEAIAIDQVMTSVEGARKLRIVVLDACRNNPFLQQMSRSSASRSIGRGLARVEPEGGTLVAFAAKAGQEALDGSGQNSPFVSALVKAIRTPNLEINKVFRIVRDDVLTTTGRKQEPFVYGSLSGEDFFFRREDRSEAVAPALAGAAPATAPSPAGMPAPAAAIPAGAAVLPAAPAQPAASGSPAGEALPARPSRRATAGKSAPVELRTPAPRGGASARRTAVSAGPAVRDERAKAAKVQASPSTGVRLFGEGNHSDSGAGSGGGSGGGTGGGGTGGGGTGGGGGGWSSDRRLKRSVRRLGRSRAGHELYSFQYVWGGPFYVGVMAQDLLHTAPDAVFLDEHGFMKVDYSRLDVEMVTLDEWLRRTGLEDTEDAAFEQAGRP